MALLRSMGEEKFFPTSNFAENRKQIYDRGRPSSCTWPVFMGYLNIVQMGWKCSRNRKKGNALKTFPIKSRLQGSKCK
jgi:hypothetical protein